MDYIDLLKKIDDKTIKNINLIHVKEPYLYDLLIDSLKKSLMDDGFLDFNFNQFDFEKADQEDVIAAIETLPMFSDKKIVILENIGLERDKLSKNKDFLDGLENLFQDFNPSTVLLMTYRSEKLFKGKFVKQVVKYGDLVDVERLNRVQLGNFIQKAFGKNKMKIDKGLADFIGQKTSYLERDSVKTLYDVENELLKLINNLGTRPLTREEIEYTMIENFDENIFHLLDAISEKNTSQALELYRGMLRANYDPFRIYYMVLRQIRNLIMVRDSQRRKLSKQTAMKYIGMSSFEYDKLARYTRAFKFSQLEDLHSYSYEIEKNIKTSRGDMDVLLELLIVKMAS